MAKLSRTKIASYFADEIANGQPDIVSRLTAVIVAEGRTRDLDLIIADIEYELNARGIIVADVTSALPLDEGFEEAVRQLLAASESDKVILREHVDPSIIGGIKIRAAGRELDASVSHKLNLLRAAKGTA